MKAVLHRAAFALAVAAATAALGGCAAQQASDMPALGAASTSGTDQAAEITGSRIPSRRSEKMVSQVGGQDYKDNKSTLTAPLRSN